MIADSSKKRQSRFQQSDRPGSLVLQDRDRQIIEACYAYRYLTRTQIQRLFGISCVTRINLRLRKLWDHRFLDRSYLPTVSGCAEAIYRLGIRAIPLVAASAGLEVEEVKRRRLLNAAISETMLPHDLAVNDFRIAVTGQIQSDRRFQLNRWWDPRDCEQLFEVGSAGRMSRTTLRPDGLFQLSFGGQPFAFFIELDLSTSGLVRLKEKFASYAQFKRFDLARQAFDIPDFSVLIVTKSAERRDNLQTLAEQTNLGFLWLACRDDLKENPLTQPVWHRPGQANQYPLFETPKVRILR